MARIAVGGFQHETNTFAPQQATWDEFVRADLREMDNCREAVDGVDEVYHLAADMGGIGYITRYHASIARNNILMDANMLEAATDAGVRRYFYSSSACVYPAGLQEVPQIEALRESDAIPAEPDWLREAAQIGRAHV